MALLFRGARVVDPGAGLDAVLDVVVRDGLVVGIGEDLSIPKGETIECSGKVLVPGLVDIHCHVRQPGREDEETVESASRAAAKGGFTAICSMPNTSPVLDTGALVRETVQAAEARAVVPVHPFGAITAGQKGAALAEMGDMAEAGAAGFTDDGRWVADTGLMRLAMDYAKQFGTVVASHCEDAALVAGGVVNEGRVSTLLGLPGWPAAAEEAAVARDIRLAELTRCPLHLQHLSTARSLALVREAKARGVRVTCEVTPHHLLLDEEALLERPFDTNLKMNPPLRTAEDRKALLEGLRDGTVDAVATDHAPHAAHEKELEFELAPFGTTGLETALAMLNTHLVAKGLLDWPDLVRLLCHGPRSVVPRLAERALEQGAVADLTVFDPEAKVEVAADRFESRSANSAFLGMKLLGKATEVLVAGRYALKNGKVCDR